MTPKETAQSYDQLAGFWHGEKFNRENGLAQHRRALQFLRKKGRALDLGCGSSGRFIDLLLAEGLAVEGLDISSEMIRLARTRHPQVTFHQADVCEWDFPRGYDFISGWDSIWHVPLARQEAMMAKVLAALNDGGVLIFTTGGVDQPGDVTNPCLGQPLYHAAPGIPNLLAWIARAGCVCRHLEYDQWPESHLYLIVQRPVAATG
ncbi:MAG: class I SAM-dependent methyltransferase [Cephaloticoccus sp.]